MVRESLGVSDEFVPFAFEVGGAPGGEAEELIGESTRVAEYNRKGLGCRVSSRVTLPLG